jgi:alpha-mannosidase
VTNRTLVVVSHTHWDREWYQPFEEFRGRLVRMMDSLLDLLDSDPEYRHFVLDGQTVPLEDYLEIRPDRRADIERLVRDRRLIIGPNYMLPDEFLIGGEAHIRNLMTGIRQARQFGEPMMVGYAPDAFGHIAHLPAILRGFGMDSVLIWRGVGDEATTSEFRWAAPDGSEVLAVHFPYGYGMLPALPEDPEILRGAIGNVRKLLEPLTTTKYVLVPNGTDHLPAHTGLSGVIRTANGVLEDAEMVHGNYPDLVQAIKAELGEEGYEKLPRLTGEFRSSKRSNVLAGVLSARIWLKQKYAACEDLLARYVEPAVAWASALDVGGKRSEVGMESTRGLLRQAWKLLLQNGPHDSVTGCSVDAVYDDVGLRFQKVAQIGEALLYESQRKIADASAPPGQDSVVVFNYENGPRADFCTIRLPVQEGKWPAKLVAPDGTEAPLQVIERGGHSPTDRRELVTFGFVARDMPGFGYRVYRAEYHDADVGARHDSPVRHEIANEWFSVLADAADGTLTIKSSATGHTYTGLNRFVDGGERGDEYTYCPPDNDAFVRSPEGLQLRVIEDGPARQTLEVRMRYRLPASLTEDRRGRSDECVPCEIVTRVSLYPDVERVDIETEIDNRARDHRLRVHFPTGTRSDRSHAEQHFGVVERPVAVPEDDGTWFESPVGTYPARSFVDVCDGDRDLMLAPRGLPEYEALEEEDGTITIALTLLRCVEWLSRADLNTRRQHAGPGMHTPGAQMQGRWKFQYSLIPHQYGWQSAFGQAHNFARPMRAIRTSRGRGGRPQESTFIELPGWETILSTMKLAEDDGSTIVRVYNISDDPKEGRKKLVFLDGHSVPVDLRASIQLNLPFSKVERVDLNEEHPTPLETEDGVVRLPLKPNEIATLRFS